MPIELEVSVNDDRSIGAIKFANWRARKVVENLDSIIEVCLPGDNLAQQREKRREVVSAYIAMINVCSFVYFFKNFFIKVNSHSFLTLT